MRLALTSQQEKVSVTASSRMRDEGNGLIFLCASHGKGCCFHIQTRQVSQFHGKQSGHYKSNNSRTSPRTWHGIEEIHGSPASVSKGLNTEAIQEDGVQR